MTATRSPEFVRLGDDFLDVINEAFRVGEAAAVEDLPSVPQLPVLMVVGPPRSGTTVLMQWLAALGEFAVPSNLLARFPKAPYLGGLTQRLLTDPRLNYRGELSVGSIEEFESVAGKTQGLLAPHEFFYFWRRFFPLEDARPLSPIERENSDPKGFARGLAALQAGLGQPLAMKGILAQYDLDVILDAIPTTILLVTRREEVDNVDSLLATRSRVMGAESAWFSVRPAGSDSMASAPAVEQAAAQVAWSNDDLDEQLALVPAERVVRVNHSEFCEDPAGIYRAIAAACAGLGHNLGAYSGPDSFEERRRTSERHSEVAAALEKVRASREREVNP